MLTFFIATFAPRSN